MAFWLHLHILGRSLALDPALPVFQEHCEATWLWHGRRARHSHVVHSARLRKGRNHEKYAPVVERRASK